MQRISPLLVVLLTFSDSSFPLAKSFLIICRHFLITKFVSKLCAYLYLVKKNSPLNIVNGRIIYVDLVQ